MKTRRRRQLLKQAAHNALPTMLRPRHHLVESLEPRQLLASNPAVLSIIRANPVGPTTGSSSVTYAVNFSAPVTGVAASDFRVVTDGGTLTASQSVLVSPVTASNYTVTVNGISGSGQLELDLVDDDSIKDSSSIPLGGAGATNGSFAGPSYTILQPAPVVQSISRAGGAAPYTWGSSASFTVTFSSPVTGVDSADFQAAPGSGVVVSGPITVTPVTSSIYSVNVAGISGAGTLGLNLVNNGTISDFGGNRLRGASPLFASQQTLSTGTYTGNVMTADVNGDGKVDVISGRNNDGETALGNGDGTFHPVINPSGGLIYNSPSIRDITGDGIPDVIATSQFTATFSRGKGDGTFSFGGVFQVLRYPQSPVTADINGDGKPDVAVAAFRNYVVCVVLGTGGGNFTAAQTFATGMRPVALQVADLNGDGKADLLSADQNDRTLSILFGNGDGTFKSRQTTALPGNPTAISVADLNSDGIPDVVVIGASGADSLNALIGNGDGSFKPARQLLTGSSPTSVEVADINGDGILDIVYVDTANNSVGWLRGNGDGSFTLQPRISVGTGPDSVSVADFNGDGNPDIAVSNKAGNTVSVLLGNNTFVGDTYVINGPPRVVSIARSSPAGDVATSSSVTFSVAFNEAVTGVDAGDFKVVTNQATSVAAPLVVTPVTSSLYNVTVNSIIGNGNLELDLIDNDSIQDASLRPLGGAGVANGSFQGQSYQVLQTGVHVQSIARTSPAGPFTSASSVVYTVSFSRPVTGVDPTDFQVPTTGGVSATLPVAVSGSGSTYTVTINGISGSGILGLNFLDDGSIRDSDGHHLGGGSPEFQTPVLIPGAPAATLMASADLNGDGFADLVTIGYTGAVSVLLGNGNGTFKTLGTFSFASKVRDLILRDVTGDGRPDICAIDVNAGNVSILAGNGDGTFRPRQTLAASSAFGLAVADVNNDGLADVVVDRGTIATFLSNGNGTFQGLVASPWTGSANDLAVADVNGDGIPDVIVPSAVLLGNGDGTFHPGGTINAPASKYSVTTADVNGDGKSDVIFNASLVLGRGDGTFDPPQPIERTSTKGSISVADVNGDGAEDVVSFYYSSVPQMAWIAGNGDGTFASKPGVLWVGAPIVPVDFNGDGDVDFVGGGVTLVAQTGSFTGPSYVINALPQVASISRSDPTAATTAASKISYAVTFSTPVTGVDTSDFRLITTGGAVTSGPLTVAGSGANYLVTVNGLRGSGTLQLELVDDDSIIDSSLTPLGGTGVGNGSFIGPVYTLQPTFPQILSIARSNPNSILPAGAPATFTVTFSKPVTGVSAAAFQLQKTGTISTSSPLLVTPVNGSTYTVTAGGLTGTGSVGLNLVDSGTIRDAAGNPLQADPTLVPFIQATFAVPGSISAVLSADVNGDGKADILFYGSSSGVLLGNGDGTFGAARTFAPGLTPAAVCDLNGDGVPDLVGFSNSARRVGLFIGNGDGIFKGPATFASDLGVYSVTAADFNNDGRIDLVMEGDFDGTCHTLLGNGNGTFASPITFAGGLGSYTPNVCDVNGDGNLDIIQASTVGGTILLGAGDGTFPIVHRERFDSLYQWTAAVLDINEDGKVDYAVHDIITNQILTFLGNGDGTFNKVALPDLVGGNGVLAADFNGDGHVDLMAGYPTTIYLGNGAGFQSLGTFSLQPLTYSAVVGDVNGDGRPDVIISSYGGSTLTILRATSTAALTGQSYTILPRVSSITRTSPSSPFAYGVNSVQYTVTFSEPMSGVDTSDFKVVTSGGAAVPGPIVVNAVNASTYTVTVSGISGSGNIALELVDDDSIVNGGGASLGGPGVGNGSFTGPIYSLAQSAPRVLSIAREGAASTAAKSVKFAVALSAPVTGVDAGDFTLTLNGVTIAPPIVVTGSGSDYEVTVNGIAGAGSLGLNLLDNGSIRDAGGNRLVQTAGGVTFSGPVTNITSASPVSVATADVNGDGIPDVITADQSANSVSILLGNGNGSFAAQRTFFAGSVPMSVAATDVNGDGKADILVADAAWGLRVLIGNGDGTFAAPVSFATGVGPTFVTAADLNSDGKIDAVLLNPASGVVCVLTGNGNGSFAPALTFGAGPLPTSLLVSDVNGDGKPDLVIASRAAGAGLSILPGLGDGTFGSRTTLAAGARPASVVTADVNRDGILDLLAGNYGSGTVSVLLGTGAGVFAAQRTYTAGTSLAALIAADVNGDGRTDLITSNPTAANVTVMLGNVDGTFAAPVTLVAGTNPGGLIAVDANGDSRADLLITDRRGSAVFVLSNIANGSITGQSYQIGPRINSISLTTPVASALHASTLDYMVTLSAPVTGLDAGDFRIVATGAAAAGPIVVTPIDPATYKVSVTAVRGSGTIELDLIDNDSITASGIPLGGVGIGNGTFTGPACTVAEVYPHVTSFVRSSPNGPVANSDTVSYSLTFNEPVNGVDTSDFRIITTGGIPSALPLLVTPSSDFTSYTITVSGIAGTGTLEVDFVDNGSAHDAVGNPLISTGTSVPWTGASLNVLGQQQGFVQTADFNGDGFPDLIASSFSNGDSIIIGNGDGTFHSPVALPTGTPLSVFPADVTGDGRVDLIYQTGTAVIVLVGNGDGTFGPPTTAFAGLQSSPAISNVGDINGDGKPDLAIFSSYTFFAGVMAGNGDGTLRAPITFAIPSGIVVGVTAVDLNNDAIPDLLSTSGNSVLAWFGNGDGTFGPAQTLGTLASAFNAVAADLNSDGITDLIVTSRGSPRLLAFLQGNGNGKFLPARTLLSSAYGLGLPCVADVDGDGRLDIVVPRYNSTIVLRGNGDGTFAPPKSFSKYSSSTTLQLPDLNQDGKPDLLLSNGLPTILLNRNTGGFAGPIFEFDSPAPHLVSLTGNLPPDSTTSAGSLVYTATFSGPVTGVDAGDFKLMTTGALAAGGLTVTSVNPSVYTITVNAIHGTGTLGLTFVDNGTVRGNGGVALAPSTSGVSLSAAPPINIVADTIFTPDVNGDGKPDLVSVSSYTVSMSLGNGDGTFSPATIVTTGVTLIGVADVNNDGKMDLVGQPSAGTSIWAMLGNGNGTFKNPSAVTTVSNIFSAFLSDINEDGKIDVVYYGYDPSFNEFVGLLSGNGDGTFAPPTVLVANTNQLQAISDINLDGHPDLLVGSRWLTIFTGDGAGNFTARQSLDSGITFESADVADLNADGIPDIVAAGYAETSILLANGNGTFAPARTFFGGSSDLAIVDMNRDGIPDLVYQTNDAVIALFGNGDGSFAPAKTIFSGANNGLPTLSIADLNNDGRPDLLLPALVAPYPSLVVLNTARAAGRTGSQYNISQVFPRVLSITPAGPVTGNSATFTVTFSKNVTGVDPSDFLAVTGATSAGPISVTATSPSVYSVTISGITGVGTLGLNLVDDGTIRDSLGNPLAQTLASSALALLRTFSTPPTRNVATGDFNGDGKTDIFCVGNGFDNVLLGNGDGTFRTASSIYTGSFGPAVVTDLNADGIPDVIQDNPLQVLLGNGDGSFRLAQSFNSSPQYFAIGDLNGDGIPDLALPDSSNLDLLLGNGDGTFATPITVATGAQILSVAIADLNQDGLTDLLVTTANGATLNVLLGNGNGTFHPGPAYSAAYSFGRLQLADINGDGVTDLVASMFTPITGGISPGPAGVMLGNGNGTFQPLRTFGSGVDYSSLNVSDLNGDGIPDLSVVGFFAGATVMFGNGDGSFQTPSTFPSRFSVDNPAIADINGDGRPDILCSNFDDQRVNLFPAADGRFSSPVVDVGSIPINPTLNGTAAADQITLVKDLDGSHVDWSMGTSSGQILANAPTGLTINGVGSDDIITLNYTNGDPLPAFLRLNGTFTINGLPENDVMPGTTLDIGQSTVYISFASDDGPISAIQNLIGRGYASGAWTGVSTSAAGAIISSAAASGPQGRFGIGYDATSRALLPGQPPKTMELRFTLVGDTNLDGVVNSTDAITVARDAYSTLPYWFYGDLNYDGKVTSADALLLQKNFGLTMPPIVGDIPIQGIVTGTTSVDTITLSRDFDGSYIDWTLGSASGRIQIADPAGLTINGNGSNDTLALNYINGNPLPATLHLNGTFTLTGLQGPTPFAGTTLDLNRSTLFITYSPGSNPLAAIQQALKSGFNSGSWTGSSPTGVITSSAAANTPHTAIGYADSATAPSINSTPNSVELKFTLIGDLNLDGSVNITDINALVPHYNSTGPWTSGDFNYDNQINITDVNALVPNYNTSLPAVAPQSIPATTPSSTSQFSTAKSSTPLSANLAASSTTTAQTLQSPPPTSTPASPADPTDHLDPDSSPTPKRHRNTRAFKI